MPGVAAKEIRPRGNDGGWIYMQHSTVATSSAKTTLRSGRRWSLMSDTGAAPTAGQCNAALGCLACFTQLILPGDWFASDASWRAPPSVIWRAYLRPAVEIWNDCRTPVDIDPPTQILPAHTAVRAVQNIQRCRADYRRMSYDRSLRQLNRWPWANVSRPRRSRSADVFPNGRVGRSGPYRLILRPVFLFVQNGGWR